jgi:hypothetical protein
MPTMHIGCSRKLRPDHKHYPRHLCALSLVVSWTVSSTWISSSGGDCCTLLPVAPGPWASAGSVPSTCPFPRVHALKGDILPPISTVFCPCPAPLATVRSLPAEETLEALALSDQKQQEFGSATNTAVLLRLVLGARIFIAHVPSDEASLQTAISECITLARLSPKPFEATRQWPQDLTPPASSPQRLVPKP